MVNRIDHPSNKTNCFYLQGAGGTGKTFLYKALCSHCRGQGKIVLCVAATSVAALLLPGGRTAHSMLKIQLELHEASVCNIKPCSPLGELLQATHLLTWDEIPTQHRYCLETIHRSLCDVRNNDAPFGGLPMLLGGDFAQTITILLHANRTQNIRACIQQSFPWPFFQVLRLSRNMRLDQGGHNAHYSS